MQYQEKVVLCEQKVVQFEGKVYSIRRATSTVRGQCVWLEEKVHIIWNFASAVRVEKCALPKGSHLQYDSVRRECVISEGLHLS